MPRVCECPGFARRPVVVPRRLELVVVDPGHAARFLRDTEYVQDEAGPLFRNSSYIDVCTSAYRYGHRARPDPFFDQALNSTKWCLKCSHLAGPLCMLSRVNALGSPPIGLSNEWSMLHPQSSPCNGMGPIAPQSRTFPRPPHSPFIEQSIKSGP